MPDYQFRVVFPDLQPIGVPSENDTSYNCVAHAAYNPDRYWDPALRGIKGYYWPPTGNYTDTIESWVSAFKLLNYMVCSNATLEKGFEKIAIYSSDGVDASHVARQLTSGVWTSKLGEYEDVEHATLEELSAAYGTVVQFMIRRRSETP